MLRRSALLYSTVSLSSATRDLHTRTVIPDTYLQVFNGYGTTTLSMNGKAAELLLNIVSNPTSIYGPCGSQWTTARETMTLVKSDQIEIIDQLVLITTSGSETTQPAGLTAPASFAKPLPTATCQTVIPDTYLQVFNGYGTTTLSMNGEAAKLLPNIVSNPTSIYGPWGSQWTTIRKIMTVIAEGHQTQIRDEPVLTTTWPKESPGLTPPAPRPPTPTTTTQTPPETPPGLTPPAPRPPTNTITPESETPLPGLTPPVPRPPTNTTMTPPESETPPPGLTPPVRRPPPTTTSEPEESEMTSPPPASTPPIPRHPIRTIEIIPLALETLFNLCPPPPDVKQSPPSSATQPPGLTTSATRLALRCELALLFPGLSPIRDGNLPSLSESLPTSSGPLWPYCPATHTAETMQSISEAPPPDSILPLSVPEDVLATSNTHTIHPTQPLLESPLFGSTFYVYYCPADRIADVRIFPGPWPRALTPPKDDRYTSTKASVFATPSTCPVVPDSSDYGGIHACHRQVGPGSTATSSFTEPLMCQPSVYGL